MKETYKTVTVELDVVDPNTGEMFQAHGTNTEHSKYYNIRNITSRTNIMDLLNIMSRTTKSPKDIEILNHLLEQADKYNEIRLNITQTAKQLSVSKPKLTLLLKALVENNFFHKLDKGVYFVNPFIFVGRRCNSNKLREEAQKRWYNIYESTTTNKEEN